MLYFFCELFNGKDKCGSTRVTKYVNRAMEMGAINVTAGGIIPCAVAIYSVHVTPPTSGLAGDPNMPVSGSSGVRIPAKCTFFCRLLPSRKAPERE